jgi:hypothetical protein
MQALLTYICKTLGNSKSYKASSVSLFVEATTLSMPQRHLPRCKSGKKTCYIDIDRHPVLHTARYYEYDDLKTGSF